jgi:hypothetical protein
MEFDNKSNYTFQDWIDGKPEPERIVNIDVSNSILINQRQAFESALKIDLRLKKLFINEDFLGRMQEYDRNEFLSLEIQKTKEYYDSLDINKQSIILGDFSPNGITAKNCYFIEKGLNNSLGCDLSFLKENLIFQGRVAYQYLKYLESLRNKYKNNDSEENTPFKNEQTKNLFDYIVKNWKNNAVNKWGYIWEYFFTKENGGLTNKTDFEAYLRKHHDFTKGKPNYESCNSEKRYNELDNLKENFFRNLDLN